MNILEEKLFREFGHRFKVVRKNDNSFEIQELITFYTDKVSGKREEFLWYNTYCVISTNKKTNNFLLVFAEYKEDTYDKFFNLICDMFENGEMISTFETEKS